MNKKILSIIFTLFLAGLLSISCSNKDTTGTGGNNDNGGGSTSVLPTVTTDGEGVSSSYRDYKYAPTADSSVTLTQDGKTFQTLNAEDQLQISVSKNDPSLQGDYAGGVLIKMPLLKDLGFKSDLIRILPANIAKTAYGYDINTLYVFSNTEEKVEYVQLQTTGIQFNANYIAMNSDFTLTKTEIVKEANKEPVTTKVVYALKESQIKTIEKANSVTPISGTPIDPSYK
ncbi:hypothetical protein [Brachyspira innocens]|uniref:hypothetical protein n=1 Tax=Brachyspira innocens TaxID=13264 RepID=UPI0026EA3A86|nr:hypothetical protein [Brachyspira innocens]